MAVYSCGSSADQGLILSILPERDILPVFSFMGADVSLVLDIFDLYFCFYVGKFLVYKYICVQFAMLPGIDRRIFDEVVRNSFEVNRTEYASEYPKITLPFCFVDTGIG